MSEVNMMTIEGKDAGKLKLSDAVFGITPNENAVREVIKNFLANNRQGTQSAKTRGDVRGGGRKPFRQKGTGRARQGSTTDPTKVGGIAARKAARGRGPTGGVTTAPQVISEKSETFRTIQKHENIKIDLSDAAAEEIGKLNLREIESLRERGPAVLFLSERKKISPLERRRNK